MEMLLRFIVGGLVVSTFAILGDVLKPRGFAGLFGAAPSVALAMLTLAVMTQGRTFAAIEGRSMMAGAVAFLVYANACLYLLGKRRLKAPAATLAALPIWFLFAFGLWALLLR